MLFSIVSPLGLTMRHAPLRMQADRSGDGPLGGGVSGKYEGTGMGTRPRPDSSMKPDVIDLEAAAASQPSKDAKPVSDSIAGGFSSRTPSLVDNLRVGDGRLAGDVGFGKCLLTPCVLSSKAALLPHYSLLTK